jgi:hypothetical protein
MCSKPSWTSFMKFQAAADERCSCFDLHGNATPFRVWVRCIGVLCVTSLGMRWLLQDHTIDSRPMVELLGTLGALLEEARERDGGGGACGAALHQLVLVLADGKFHEKESLQRAVRELADRRGVLLAFIVLDSDKSKVGARIREWMGQTD